MGRWQMLRQNAGRNGYLLLGGGVFCSLLGAAGTIAFLREIQLGGRIPPGQIAARLILPHVVLLLGFGLLLAGVLMLRRNAVLRDRTKPEE